VVDSYNCIVYNVLCLKDRKNKGQVMKFVLESVTYHSAAVEAREKLMFGQQQRIEMLKKMATEKAISEAVILETCNRIEFYTYTRDDFHFETFLRKLIGQVKPDAVGAWTKYRRQIEGIEVVRHLFKVSAGLDSQMIGENQVLSQVKAAYTESVEGQMSKFVFHKLFHNAFRVGKAVRTETNISSGAVSISLAAVELAKERIDLAKSTAMILGAGENAELAAQYLITGGLAKLIIANRGINRAKALQARLKTGRVIGLKDIAKHLDDVNLLIGSTASDEPVVTYKLVKNELSGRKKQLLIIDIAVPRDIEPQVKKFKCVKLYNIDDLNDQISTNVQRRNGEIPRAGRIVEDFTKGFAKWYESLEIVPLITKLTRAGVDLAHAEVNRYGKDFSKADQEKLKVFAESLVKKVLHGPICFLKADADEQARIEQLQAIELVNKMFLSQDSPE